MLLVKPQFELQPEQISKAGLVKSKASYVEVENRLWQACKALKLKVQRYFQSPIAGTGVGSAAGNIEFFVWAQLPGGTTEVASADFEHAADPAGKKAASKKASKT